MSSEVARLFRDAAEVIERRGWHQGSYMGPGDSETCAVCGLGALNVAAGRSADDDGDYLTAAVFGNWLYEHAPLVPETSVVGWNDDPNRSADEVVTAFRAYADHLDAQG